MAIGAVLFGLNYYINGKNNSKTTIIIPQEEQEVYEKMATNNGTLNSAILEKLIEKRIEQELLYQYGMSLNLTKSDGKIKEQLISAAQNIILAQAPISDPGDKVLSEYFNSNKLRMTHREVYDFEQYYFGNKFQEAQQALFLINAGNAIENGDSLNIPNEIKNTGKLEIAQQFGVLFSDSLTEHEIGWRGIIKSDFGFHVVTSYSKKTITMNMKNSRNEIFNSWKNDQQKLFYTKFLKELKEEADIEMNLVNS